MSTLAMAAKPENNDKLQILLKTPHMRWKCLLVTSLGFQMSSLPDDMEGWVQSQEAHSAIQDAFRRTYGSLYMEVALKDALKSPGDLFVAILLHDMARDFVRFIQPSNLMRPASLWKVAKFCTPLLLTFIFYLPSFLASLIVKVAQRRSLTSPPGMRLRQIADFFFSKKSLDLVFDPLVGDLQHEYFSALAEKRHWKAEWIHAKYSIIFLITMIRESAASVVDLLAPIIKPFR